MAAPLRYTKGSTPTLDGGDREYLARELRKIEQSIASFIARVPLASGSFTCAAAATTTVTQASVTASGRILLTPTNAAAATLMGSVKSLYISARTAGTSFAVTTASGAAAAGTETFEYVIVP
jgi:hypothetical protein